MTARDAPRSQLVSPRETSLLLTDGPFADIPLTGDPLAEGALTESPLTGIPLNRSLAVSRVRRDGVPPPATPDLNDLRLVTPEWPLGLSVPSVLISGEFFLRVSAPAR
jgi:hypothetical protein